MIIWRKENLMNMIIKDLEGVFIKLKVIKMEWIKSIHLIKSIT